MFLQNLDTSSEYRCYSILFIVVFKHRKVHVYINSYFDQGRFKSYEFICILHIFDWIVFTHD